MAKTPSHEKVETPTKTVMSTASDEIVVCAPEQIQGLVAERYELIEKIGAGGMSVVYKVRHIHLDRIFALKLLHKTEEELSILRFQQEAKASTVLEHPNIIKVTDFGVNGGKPYMVMDFVDGLPLSDIIKKEGPLPSARITRIFGQICQALAHAHEQNIIHRDIKPSNIIIKDPGSSSEQAIVVDFGIAKILTDDNDDAQNKNLTRTGDIFGTPHYMSPEQCEGRKVDGRSDIYSLGCLLYESITGSPPFEAESIYQVIHKHITEAPTPFSEALCKTQAGRQLESLVLKAMAKSPADRHKYVQELASELKEIEYGRSGFWSELIALPRALKRRIKAGEQRSFQIQWTIRLTAILALIFALLLLILPGQMQKTNREYKRNAEIISLCNLASRDSYINTDNSFYLDDEFLKREKRIGQLCQGEQKRLYNNFHKILANLHKQARTMESTVAEGLSSSGLGLDSFMQMKRLINNVAGECIEAGKINNQILNIAYQKADATQHQLQVLTTARTACQVLSAPVAILLLLALLRRTIDARSKAKEEQEIYIKK